MIGVSDGFVLGTHAAKIQIMAAAMFNEYFLDQLRKKVLRGMKGAAERGTSLGGVRYGYKLVEKLDTNGNPIINSKDKPVRIPVIDEDVMKWVVQAAKWVADDHKSYKWIARQFNSLGLNGSKSWSGSRISTMLACPLYVGVRIFNRNRSVWDSETGEIKLESVKASIGNLRGLLEQSVEKSASLLRTLLGRVPVQEVVVEGRKRKLWVGSVNGDMVPFMAKASRLLQTPDSDTWEFLCNQIWKFNIEAEVKLVDPPAYERNAGKFKALYDDGASVVMIASAHEVSVSLVQQAIRFAETCTRPLIKSGGRSKQPGQKRDTSAQYKGIAEDVSRLKDQQMTIPKIITWLAEHRGIQAGEATVRRAWNHANPEAVKVAVAGRVPPPARASHRHLPHGTFAAIMKGLENGRSFAAIAKLTGCGTSTVYREAQRLKRSGELHKDAAD